MQTCPSCGGSGKVVKEKCPKCGGTGYKKIKKTINAKIPAGVDNGISIRIPGLGEPGKNGGPRGNLYVTVQVQPHQVFQRRDFDIYSTVPISFADAALGAQISIPTVDGDIVQTVQPGTQTGTVVRLRGKGVPYLKSKNQRGDHFATLVVQVPKKMNSEQKELLRRFDDAMNGKPVKDVPEGKKKKGFMDKLKETFDVEE